MWTHGDFIQVNRKTEVFLSSAEGKTRTTVVTNISDIGWHSDGVLNPSGVRFGSSEIYSILAGPRFSGLVTDYMVVGQQRAKSPYSDPAERVLLFIQCSQNSSSGTMRPRPDLEAAIREQIAQDLSRRHVPTYVFEVDEIPYNANGKKMEIQVKAVVGGGADALRSLKLTEEEFRQIARFEGFYEIEKVVKSIVGTVSKL